MERYGMKFEVAEFYRVSLSTEDWATSPIISIIDDMFVDYHENHFESEILDIITLIYFFIALHRVIACTSYKWYTFLSSASF